MNNIMDSRTLNLSGEWIGAYDGQFEQVIQIIQTGDEIVATKITGDSHVPGGKVTFTAHLRTGNCLVQVAEQDFRNATFVPGRFVIENPERATVTITDTNTGLKGRKIMLRKDD